MSTDYTFNVMVSGFDGTPVYDSGEMVWTDLAPYHIKWLDQNLGRALRRMVFFSQRPVEQGFSVVLLQRTTVDGVSSPIMSAGANHLPQEYCSQLELILVGILSAFAKMRAQDARSR